MIKRDVPKLVVIDTHKLLYSRYVGSIFDMRAKAERPLTREEVEIFRTNPSYLIENAPEAA